MKNVASLGFGLAGRRPINVLWAPCVTTPGQEGAGITANDHGKLQTERGLGLLADVFRDPRRWHV